MYVWICCCRGSIPLYKNTEFICVVSQRDMCNICVYSSVFTLRAHKLFDYEKEWRGVKLAYICTMYVFMVLCYNTIIVWYSECNRRFSWNWSHIHTSGGNANRRLLVCGFVYRLFVQLVRMMVILEKRLDDLGQTCVRSDDQTRNADQHNDRVDKHHSRLSETRRRLPVDKQLDEGGESETKGGQTESTKQRDEQLQIGNGYGQEDCNRFEIRTCKPKWVIQNKHKSYKWQVRAAFGPRTPKILCAVRCQVAAPNNRSMLCRSLHNRPSHVSRKWQTQALP